MACTVAASESPRVVNQKLKRVFVGSVDAFRRGRQGVDWAVSVTGIEGIVIVSPAVIVRTVAALPLGVLPALYICFLSRIRIQRCCRTQKLADRQKSSILVSWRYDGSTAAPLGGQQRSTLTNVCAASIRP